MLGHVITPPLWAAEQPAPGGKQAACLAVTLLCPWASWLCCVPPQRGLASPSGWLCGEKESREEQCLQSRGPAAIPSQSFPWGTGAAGLALVADNTVSVLAARYQRHGGGQTRSDPEHAVLGDLLGRGLCPLHPTTSPRALYFCTSCFLSGLTPSHVVVRVRPGPLCLISLP